MSRSFLSGLKGQAQSALKASPLAGHLPSAITGDQSGQGAAPASSSSQGGSLAQIQHSIRSLKVQYSHQASPEIRQLELLITGDKGIALDFDGLSRDFKSQSKEIYIWGQSEKEDVKDVTDRLAYLTFVHGSLASSVGTAIEASRAPFKAVRDAETGLVPRRNIRAGIEQQIVQFKTQGGRAGGVDAKIASLEDQLRKAESDDASLEREVELLKRTAVRETETKKWAALREYSEKLLLIAQAAEALIAALPAEPPTPQNPYRGAESTAATRVSLQRALDNYQTGQINFQHQPAGAALDYRNSLSFGQTHANELSAIQSQGQGQQQQPQQPYSGAPGATTPGQYTPQPQHLDTPHSYTPPAAQYPTPGGPGGGYGAPVPVPTPHVADTYPPQSATPPVSATAQPQYTAASVPPSGSAGGYGSPAATPVHESAEDEKRRLAAERAAADAQAQAPASSSSSTATPSYASTTPSYPTASGSQGGYQPPPQHESAEDEKKRLAREDRERILAAPAEHKNETAEEEKRRLEREQRDRYLASFGDPKPGEDEAPSGDAPPSYQG